MNKPVPNAVAQFLVEERRQNTELRAKIDRLLAAARAVADGAEHAGSNCCEVALEDIKTLDAALKEWGKS